MAQTPKEIQYEEWIKAANSLVSMIDKGTSTTKPWPYKSGKNLWRVFPRSSQVIVSYRPGRNSTDKFYSQFVSRKGTKRRFFSTQSIYQTEIKPKLIPEVTDALLDSLSARLQEYFRIQLKAEVDQYQDLEFKFST